MGYSKEELAQIYKFLRGYGFKEVGTEYIQLTDDLYCTMDVPNDRIQRVSCSSLNKR